MTNTEYQILVIDNRIALLQSRTDKENGKIVQKLLRKKRNLLAAQ